MFLSLFNQISPFCPVIHFSVTHSCNWKVPVCEAVSSLNPAYKRASKLRGRFAFEPSHPADSEKCK